MGAIHFTKVIVNGSQRYFLEVIQKLMATAKSQNGMMQIIITLRFYRDNGLMRIGEKK